MKKWCGGCEEDKDVGEFSKDKSKKDGLCSRCKECVKKYKKKNRNRIAKYQKEYNKSYRKENKERLATNAGVYREKNKKIISTKKKIYNDSRKDEKREYDKLYRERNAERIRKYQSDYALKNKNRIKVYKQKYYLDNKERATIKSKHYRENNKDKVYSADKLYRESAAKYTTFCDRLTIDEASKLGSDGVSLEVRCKYCGKYFTPNNKSVHDRIYSLNNNTYDNFLYCYYGCKQACPIYGQKLYPKGFKKSTSREVQPELRKLVLERDNWQCQKCGKSVDEVELHCHHILPINESPVESADIDNCITLCKKHHKQAHKLPGCGLGELKC